MLSYFEYLMTAQPNDALALFLSRPSSLQTAREQPPLGGGSLIRVGASCKQASHYGRGGNEGDGEGTILLPKG